MQGHLWFHTDFKFVSSISVKCATEIFIGIALNLYIALGSIDLFTILILPTQEKRIFFPIICVFFNFIYHCLIVVSAQIFTSLAKFIPKYSIVLDGIINETVFFFLSFCVFLSYTHGTWRFPGQELNRSCSHRPSPEPQQPGI